MDHFWQIEKVKKIHRPLRKWQNSAWQNEAFLTKSQFEFHYSTKWAFGDNIEKWKNTRASQKMTKLSIFDKIVLWQHNGVEKSYLSQFEDHFSKMTKWAIFDKIEKVKKILRPLRKWQNWAFLTKLKKQNNEITYCTYTISHNLNSTFPKWQNGPLVTILKMWKNTRASQKMTKLSIFDTIDEAKNTWASQKVTKWAIFDNFEKSEKTTTALSENDKIKHFWQNTLVWYITTPSVYIYLSHNLKSTFQNWQNGPFLTNWKSEKNTQSAFHKMTKWDHFWQKIEKLKKKCTGLSENDKIKHFWQNSLKKRKNTRVSQKMTKLSIFDKIVWYITTHTVT